MLIRVGDTVINLDNVMAVDLDFHPDGDSEEGESSQVVFEFVMRGMDELDEGQNFTQPYLKIFTGEAATAIRRHFQKTCPDLLTAK